MKHLLICGLLSCAAASMGPEDCKTHLLYQAIANNKPSFVRELLDNGALVRGYESRLTPLMLAAKVGNEQIVQLLLDAGADPKFANCKLTTVPMFVSGVPQECLTALDIAKWIGHTHIVALLKNYKK